MGYIYLLFLVGVELSPPAFACCMCVPPAVVAATVTEQRLPLDFEPFFAVDRRPRRLDNDSTSSASTTQDGTSRERGTRVAGLTFRLLFAVFSSRHWDRLYLFLSLSWAVLCPGYLDGAIDVERAQLASLLLLMFVVAGTPAMLALVLKVFFSVRLRSRLLHDDRRHFVVRERSRDRKRAAGYPLEN